MQNEELINTPIRLLMLAAAVGGLGILLVVISKMSYDISSREPRERDTRHYRDMGALDKLTAHYSDYKPVSLRKFGRFMIFTALCMAIAALIWYFKGTA